MDISKESILIAVGRGIENEENVVIAGELAEAIGGSLCASRPGRSGLAANHTPGGQIGLKPEAQAVPGFRHQRRTRTYRIDRGSDVIIAVNTDVNAPIFNIAKYGITDDLIDITAALAAALKEAKGGKMPHRPDFWGY